MSTPRHPTVIGPARRPGRHPHLPARALGPILAAVIALAGACGIAVGDPEALPAEGHEDLLQGTTTTTTVAPVSETVEHRLFFIGPDDKLETIQRPYPANVQINTVLKALEQPPGPDEQPAETEEVGLLRSLVPPGLDATLLEGDPADAARRVRVLSVNPEAELRMLLEESPVQARLIVSQVVCTFLRVSPEGTAGVEIADDQGTIQLADDAAQPINGPAVEEDFGGCKTGTEERLELLEAGAESTTTTEPAE